MKSECAKLSRHADVARLESGRALPTTTTASLLHVDLVLPASAPMTKDCANAAPDAH